MRGSRRLRPVVVRVLARRVRVDSCDELSSDVSLATPVARVRRRRAVVPVVVAAGPPPPAAPAGSPFEPSSAGMTPWCSAEVAAVEEARDRPRPPRRRRRRRAVLSCPVPLASAGPSSSPDPGSWPSPVAGAGARRARAGWAAGPEAPSIWSPAVSPPLSPCPAGRPVPDVPPLPRPRERRRLGALGAAPSPAAATLASPDVEDAASAVTSAGASATS